MTTPHPLATSRARSPRLARLLTGLLAGSLLLTGCATGGASAGDGGSASATATAQKPLADLHLVPDPKDYTGESTAVLPRQAISQVEAHPAQTLPTTITSHDTDGDRRVTIADTSRVVAVDIAGSIAGIAWGLGFGDTLVGRDIATTFPGARDLPVVTDGSLTVNAEAILSLHPSLVITDGTVGPRDVLQQLRDSGIAVVFVKNSPSFEGAQELARQVAAVFGAPKAGDELADRIGRQVKDKIAEIAAIAPKQTADKLRIIFLYLRGQAGIYYLFGEGSGADDLIDALGGVDVAKEIGWNGMKPMTDEAIVAARPDLILVMTDGLKSAGGVDGLLDVPGVADTTAGVDGCVVDMDDAQILSFGPQFPATLRALAEAIYGRADAT
jgi:iron complex transport system substrate-binding protein